MEVQSCQWVIKDCPGAIAGTVSLLYENEYGTVQAPYLLKRSFLLPLIIKIAFQCYIKMNKRLIMKSPWAEIPKLNA